MYDGNRQAAETKLKTLLEQLMADVAAGAKVWPDPLKDFLNQRAAVVERYCYGIFRKRRHQPADAENLALQAFLKIWRAVDCHPPKEPGKVLAWIRRIAKNLSIDHRKKQDREAKWRGPAIDDVSVVDPVDFAAELARAELRKAVKDAVKRLDARHQMVVIFHMNGLKHKEIAQRIGASEKASQRLWKEALKLLRPLLESYL